MKQRVEKIRIVAYIFFAFCLLTLAGCKDDDVEVAPAGSASINKTVEEINTNLRALQKLIVAKVDNKDVKFCTQISNSTYRVELGDGNSFSFLTRVTTLGEKEGPAYSPVVSALQNGDSYYWTLDGNYLTVGGKNMEVVDGVVPTVSIDGEGYWTVACGGEVQRLAQKVENGTVKSLFGEVDQTNTKEVRFFLRGDIPSLSLVRTDGGGGDPIPPTNTPRRPISPDHPAWLIHIDTWNTPDPQAIIDLIPEDIRPYVIFNISLSINHDGTTGAWKNLEYGYETAKSWLRTCAENNVWAMIQPASGGFSHFPDYSSYADMESEKSVFYEFYRDYPNFVGFNYCEQFWGFDDPYSVTYPQRLQHWTHLMQLSHKYGGYLVISHCGSGEYSSSVAPLAMLKRDATLAAMCKQHPENLIVCEKFTSTAGFFDIESACLGIYLSGYAGQYGMRFDVCGWPDEKVWNGDAGFQTPAGAIPMIEHIMLTGQTVYDGPELIWTEDFKEVKEQSAGDGYTKRAWERFPQFDNINIDIYRKIIDGTIRIMTRKEVIDRTKFIVINDISPQGGTLDPGYLTPATLFEGLYRLDEDGNQNKNILYFKKTGRYPTIPMAMDLADELANSFIYKINASQFNGGWDNIQLKQGKFNRVFPEEYTGEMYAGRHENGWVVYNPLAGVRNASIPFKYNTCEKMELAFGKYTTSVIKEYADKIDFYLTNYTTEGTQTTDVIKIYGSSQRPTYTYKNRINSNSCSVSEEWADNVFTLTVKHNGAVDIKVNCAGIATDRETSYTMAGISAPITPKDYWGKDYDGACQYEAEHFEYKNVQTVYKSAVNDAIRYYTGMGYLNFGTSADAAVRDRVTVNEAGTYTIKIKYNAPVATINTVELYINGSKMTAPIIFTQTDGSEDPWQTVAVSVSLDKGQNTVELKANSSGAGDLYLDNMIVEK